MSNKYYVRFVYFHCFLFYLCVYIFIYHGICTYLYICIYIYNIIIITLSRSGTILIDPPKNDLTPKSKLKWAAQFASLVKTTDSR